MSSASDLSQALMVAAQTINNHVTTISATKGMLDDQNRVIAGLIDQSKTGQEVAGLMQNAASQLELAEIACINAAMSAHDYAQRLLQS